MFNIETKRKKNKENRKQICNIHSNLRDNRIYALARPHTHIKGCNIRFLFKQ